jgi:hypothetical protein
MENARTARPRWLIWAIIVCLALGVWYGIVLVLLPQVSNGVPGLPLSVRSMLWQHFRDVQAGRRSFGEIDKRRVGRDNTYHLVVYRRTGPETSMIVAYPDKWRPYRHTVLYRFAFLDFGAHRYPSFLLRSDGLFCENSAAGFSATHPPTLADLDVDHGRHWEARMLLPEWFAEPARRAAQTRPTAVLMTNTSSGPASR